MRWMALDEALATVDDNGNVTGRSPGSARVLATAVYSDGRLVIVPFRVNDTAPVAPASPPE